MSDRFFNESKPYIFVSYSHKDEDTVEKTLSELHERFGINIWYDDELYAGTNWDDVALPKLRGKGCMAVLLFASMDALISENVEKELNKAKKYKKPIIPINFQSKSFEDIVTEDVNDKYNDTDSKKVTVAERLVENHLPEKLTYIVCYPDSDKYYNDICKAIKNNAPDIEISDSKFYNERAKAAPKPARDIRPARLDASPAVPVPAPESPAPAVSEPAAPTGEEYKLITANTKAYCAVVKIANGEYTLLKGSKLKIDCAPSIPFASVKIREESSQLDRDGNRIVFEDVVRNAPSSITGAIKGGSDDGVKTLGSAKSISKDEIGNYLKSTETAAVKEPVYAAAPASESPTPAVSETSAPTGEEYRLVQNKDNTFCAVVKITNGEYTLLKGSKLKTDCAPSTQSSAVRIREESSQLDPGGNRIVFEDVIMTKPSGITGAIKGVADDGVKTLDSAKSISKDEIGKYLTAIPL